MCDLLLCLIFRLLNYACASQATLPTAEVLLNNEITWLKRVKVGTICQKKKKKRKEKKNGEKLLHEPVLVKFVRHMSAHFKEDGAFGRVDSENDYIYYARNLKI